MSRNGQSIGEMISTLCFGAVALWLGFEALTATVPGATRALFGLCALASALGALRFPLRRLAERWRG